MDWDHRGHRGNTEEVFPETSSRILKAAFKVHSAVGPGLLEAAYEACLCHELARMDIPFQRRGGCGCGDKVCRAADYPSRSAVDYIHSSVSSSARPVVEFQRISSPQRYAKHGSLTPSSVLPLCPLWSNPL